MTDVVRIDPADDSRWKTFLDRHADATVFHDPAWITLQMQSYGFTQASLACITGDRITGILPLLQISSPLTGKRGVSLPFSDYGGPLADDPGSMDALMKSAAALSTERRWKYLELRGNTPPGLGQPAAAFKRHRLQLSPGPDALFRSFDKGQTQRSVNKFGKSGAVVERRTDMEAVVSFMRLNYRTRRKHGLPPQPDRFFEELHRTLLATGRGFVGVARLGGTDLGACLFLLFKDTVYYKFGASDEAQLVHRPNHGIMWDAIRWAAGEGYRMFDFGRSDLDGEGLIKFKRGWGTEETDLTYYRMSAGAATREGGGPIETLKPLLQRMPIPILKLIGKVLYEHVG